MQLAALVQIFFFYQPLFWWLRRQLRLCQDYLADARAAEQAAEAEDYADYLVGLTGRLLRGPSPVALGIGDRRSQLYRRITMLVDNRKPLERHCRRAWNVAVTVGAVALCAAVAAVRLDAEAPPPAQPTSPAKGKEVQKESPKEAKAEETLAYTGQVVEKGTGKPIAGATVTVRRSVSGDPKVQGRDLLQETKHKTDAQGKYHFTIPPEQVANRWLYIELDVEHPSYASKTGFGYALGMIRKNEKLGGRPFFEKIELFPGKEVTGRVETPDGQPAVGVKVLAFSAADNRDFEAMSFARARTDGQGRFRIVLHTPGQGILWLLPEKYAPSTHPVNERRGDLGLLGLQKGIVLKGKLVDVKGNPLAGVYVNARREGREEMTVNLPVAGQIQRSDLTSDRGEFELAPLPGGEYRVQPGEYSHDASKEDRRRPVPGVFIAQKVTLKEGEQPEPLEVRAVPHVTIEAQYVDSKGQPRTGHECFIHGRIDKGFWNSMGRPDANGKIVAQVPHGLDNAQMDLVTNEHGVLRWRRTKDGPLTNKRQVDLGTVNEDVKGIEIVRYTAPILLINAVDKDHRQIKDFKAQVVYAPGKSPKQPGSFFVNGVQGDVFLEKQEDGRWRSQQLFPDEELTVTAQAPGYAPKSERLKLPEGTTKELELVLEKKGAE
jgi:hypothetical protein